MDASTTKASLGSQMGVSFSVLILSLPVFKFEKL